MVETIVAIDIDDETTPNAQIGYAILAINPGGLNADSIPDPTGLFAINEITGELRLMKHGRGFYGNWLVEIEAFDHGHLWDTKVQLRSSEVYTIHLEPYNFHAPQLIYPNSGMMHRFRFTLPSDFIKYIVNTIFCLCFQFLRSASSATAPSC